jgi:hypothetical protein
MSTRKQTSTTISSALLAWNSAPIHVRAMAGGFVLPLISALSAINSELAEIQQKIGKDDQGHGSET